MAAVASVAKAQASPAAIMRPSCAHERCRSMFYGWDGSGRTGSLPISSSMRARPDNPFTSEFGTLGDSRVATP
jgi:hypothetical protein